MKNCEAAYQAQNIVLIGRYNSPEVAQSIEELADTLTQRGCRVFLESETAANMARRIDVSNRAVLNFSQMGQGVDLAIVIGGDGTMLNAARGLARYRVPLVGVNQGRLGFMTDIPRAELLPAMDDLLAGLFLPEERLILDAEVIHEQRTLVTNLALNDVVVDKGAIGRMIEFELCINGEFVYNLRADGLIVATPTGSTAYALSAHGPIMEPSIASLALVPLCPHGLTNRPVIVGAESLIEIRIIQATDCRVHFDGQLTVDLKVGDTVRLQRSSHAARFLHPPGYSYFRMLRHKLRWSEGPTEATTGVRTC